MFSNKLKQILAILMIASLTLPQASAHKVEDLYAQDHFSLAGYYGLSHAFLKWFLPSRDVEIFCPDKSFYTKQQFSMMGREVSRESSLSLGTFLVCGDRWELPLESFRSIFTLRLLSPSSSSNPQHENRLRETLFYFGRVAWESYKFKKFFSYYSEVKDFYEVLMRQFNPRFSGLSILDCGLIVPTALFVNHSMSLIYFTDEFLPPLLGEGRPWLKTTIDSLGPLAWLLVFLSRSLTLHLGDNPEIFYSGLAFIALPLAVSGRMLQVVWQAPRGYLPSGEPLDFVPSFLALTALSGLMLPRAWQDARLAADEVALIFDRSS